MLQMLILVCSINLSPSDCQADTALDVIRGPKVANAMECGMHGQAYIAQTALMTRGTGEYLKIRCTPSRAVQGPMNGRKTIGLNGGPRQRHEQLYAAE